MTNEIAVIVNENPVVVLTDAKTYSSFYAHMKAEIDAHVPDLTTVTGRKAIASLAFKVAKTKTAIDDAGKLLNEEARIKINAVDAARRKIRDELDALRDLARKPLTDWEEAEDARVKRGQDLVAYIQAVGNGFIGPDLQPYALLFRELEEKVAPQITADLGEYEQIALDAARAARERLEAAFEADKKARADREELEKLRQDQAERDEKDRLALEAKIAEEAKRIAAKEAQEASAKAEADHKAKMEAVAKAAEEAAKAEAEKKAHEEREATAKAHHEALAAEKKRADDAEAARKADEEKANAEAAKRVQEAQAAADKLRREKEEQDAREKDRAHRGKIMGEAKAYLIELGMDEALAKTVVLAIVANSVPHVSLRF